MEIDFFKLIANNLVSVVIAYMLLKFFIEIMRKKLLGDSEIEKQNLEKNIEIFNSLTNLNNKFNNSHKDINNCFSKTIIVLDKISRSQDKLCTLIESLDRRINGQKK
jgi:anaerobic C4-dicarboxylate transporter